MTSRKCLLLDTTFQGISAAIVTKEIDKEARFLSASYHFDNNGSAALLPLVISGLLKKSQIGLNEIDLFAVSNGPGSFTGIKVGLSYISGLVLGLSKKPKVLGVSSLKSLSFYEKNGYSDKVWLLPATKTQGYLAISYRETADLYMLKLSNIIELFCVDSGERISSKILDKRKLMLVLPWVLAEEFFSSAGIYYEVMDYPVAAARVLSAIASQLPDDLDRLSSNIPEPRYIRKSTPEENLEKN
ncbi:MAG: tRNA (adenosine(37)-N6)-threonylcarbamoyltransferase complex dimerization subunit type 1 TsaB [Oligoflexales bacterium]|nr:tRNA (adenosine(37)-N6)-threonylcarbamoyltransferase complex dimerization subunit type 1 TsaB [Oligoflexales bacterium]